MPNENGWRSPLDAEMERSFQQMPIIDQRTGTVNRPQQMPRGTNFGQQGGYQGQVYNTPPMQQPMAQPMPMPMGQITQQDAQMMARPMQPPMPQQNGMGRMYPQLSPQDIEVFRNYQRQQEVERELQRMFMQEKMRGMLGE